MLNQFHVKCLVKYLEANTGKKKFMTLEQLYKGLWLEIIRTIYSTSRPMGRFNVSRPMWLVI